jgi:peptidoglycan/LPS O-acetylase OafA/YrhL
VLAPVLPKHIPSLDGLRGCSVLIVLLGHASATNQAPVFLDHTYIHSLGNVGVRFFFVLSGFLITTLLLREWDQTGGISLKNFYIRRARRILPAILAYIAIIWTLYIFGVIDLRYHLYSGTVAESAIPDLVRALTFTANFHHDYNWYFNHLWSLSVEEQFYLIWPLVMILSGPRRWLHVSIIIICITPFVRWYMYLNLTGNYVAVSREFQAICDSLLTGAVAAMLFNYVSENRKLKSMAEGKFALVTGVLMLGIGYASVLIRPEFSYVFGQTFSNFGIALILQYLVRSPGGLIGKFVSNRIFVWFGLISYSLYIWQQPFTNFKLSSFEVSFPQNIVLAIMAAFISYSLIERAFISRKNIQQSVQSENSSRP